MTKILFDARTLGTKPSGIGIYVYNIVMSLITYEDLEIVFATDVCESEQMLDLKKKGIRVTEYGKKTRKDYSLIQYCKFLKKCIEYEKPNIFWEPNNMLPLNVNNKYGEEWVTIHDVFGARGDYGNKYALYSKYAINKTINSFDVILYNSEDTKNEVEKIFPKAKGKENRIFHTPVPTPLNVAYRDNNSFLYVGNVEKRKGVDLLISAYKKYRNCGGSKRLRIAGKIREEEFQVSIRDDIDYLGYVTESEKNDELASCSAFVFTSRAEGLGVPIVEAMQFYKPIITSDLPVINDVFGDAVIRIPINDEILAADSICTQLLEIDSYSVNKEKYSEIIENFSLSRIGKDLHDYIQTHERYYKKINQEDNSPRDPD